MRGMSNRFARLGLVLILTACASDGAKTGDGSDATPTARDAQPTLFDLGRPLLDGTSGAGGADASTALPDRGLLIDAAPSQDGRVSAPDAASTQDAHNPSDGAAPPVDVPSVSVDARVPPAVDAALADAAMQPTVDAAVHPVVDAAPPPVLDAVVPPPVDASPGACQDGERRRCWVECGQAYPAGCIHGEVPPSIMGISTCGLQAWGACQTLTACAEVADACQPGDTHGVDFECVDGGLRHGLMNCFRPLGAQCAASFYGGFGITECVLNQDQLCTQGPDICDNDGVERPCEAHCDTPDGPIQAGTQRCNAADCGGALGHFRYWGACNTHDACAQ